MFQQKHHILASLITSFSYSVTQSLGNYLRGLKKICGHKPVLLNKSLQQHSTITLWCSGVAAILQSGTRTPLQCGFHKTAIMATMDVSVSTGIAAITVIRERCGTTRLFPPPPPPVLFSLANYTLLIRFSRS